MTDQEVFDIVAEHLLRQGEVALDSETGSCAYRGSDGRKCAIGVLIPDGSYKQELEGLSASQSAVLKAAGLRHSQADLAGSLQFLHDCTPPEAWACALRDVARRHRLLLDESIVDRTIKAMAEEAGQ